MNIDYSKALEKAKQLFNDNKLIKQDCNILLDTFIDDIAGEGASLTVKKHITIAQSFIGVPLYCTIEKEGESNFLVFRNLKTFTLIDRKLWHLPYRLKNITYSFVVVWVDDTERKEFDPELTKPVIITNIN